MTEARSFNMQSPLWGKVFVLTFIAMVGVTGCGKLIPKLDEVVTDNRKAYQKAETLPDLEVPPDLSTVAIRDRMAIPEGGQAARFSTYQERRAEVVRAEELEAASTSAIKVLENEHVLVASGAPQQVWPDLVSFWKEENYPLDLNDVELGIIETEWIESDDQLSRHRFKLFAEGGEQGGTTVLYISHENQELIPEGEDLVWATSDRDSTFERRIVESLESELSGSQRVTDVLARDEGKKTLERDGNALESDPKRALSKQRALGEGQIFDLDTAEKPEKESIWTKMKFWSRPASSTQTLPERIGFEPKVSGDTAAASKTENVTGRQPENFQSNVNDTEDSTPVRKGAAEQAQIVEAGGGKLYLNVSKEYSFVWETTGEVLKTAGINVKDSDRGRGLFVVEVRRGDDSGFQDDPSVWGKMKFWDRNGNMEYKISLTGVGQKTEVVVLDRNGRWKSGTTANRLLNHIKNAFNEGQI